MELMNANFEFVTCAKLSVVEMHNIGSPTITLLSFLTILEKFANFVKLSDVIKFTKNFPTRKNKTCKNYVLYTCSIIRYTTYKWRHFNWFQNFHTEKYFIKFYDFLLPKMFTLTCNDILNKNVGFKWDIKSQKDQGLNVIVKY
jgi:hypothetical protein